MRTEFNAKKPESMSLKLEGELCWRTDRRTYGQTPANSRFSSTGKSAKNSYAVTIAAMRPLRRVSRLQSALNRTVRFATRFAISLSLNKARLFAFVHLHHISPLTAFDSPQTLMRRQTLNGRHNILIEIKAPPGVSTDLSDVISTVCRTVTRRVFCYLML